jgi:poly-gamma-glutamate capsule biosynthesis protein CapA/YwtB (metallophosphatase superfamily)
LDYYKGRPIVYSLGNLVFPGRGPNPAFHKKTVLRLELSRHGEAWGATATTSEADTMPR